MTYNKKYRKRNKMGGQGGPVSKGTCPQTLQFEIDTWGPHGTRREVKTASCPLTATCAHTNMCVYKFTK